MIRIIEAVQPSTLPPAEGQRIEYIVGILDVTEAVAAAAAGMTKAGGEQRRDRQADEDRAIGAAQLIHQDAVSTV